MPYNFSEPRAVFAVFASLILPIPFLSALNQHTANYPLDQLHYSLFQLLLCALVPTAMSASGKNLKTEEAFLQTQVAQTGSCEALQQPQKKTRVESAIADKGAEMEKADVDAGEDGDEDENENEDVNEKDSDNASHRYAAKCAELENTFLKLASAQSGDDGAAGSSNPWTPLTTVSKPYPISVQGHVSKPFCFRITFFAPTMPATAFDLLADILRRPEWDELTESTKIIEKLGHGDSIHYVKAKAIWPTAARDSVLISHITALDISDASGKATQAFLNVSQSIVDERMPERDSEGIVRMEAGIAGQLITRATDVDRMQNGLQGEHWCKVVQIADGDLKGWIPKSVIKFIATQALPRSLTKVCKQLSELPPSPDSQPVTRMSNISSRKGKRPMLQIKADTSLASTAVVANKLPLSEMRRGRWLVWIKIILKYAGPSIIAAVTSILVNLLIQRRFKRSL